SGGPPLCHLSLPALLQLPPPFGNAFRLLSYSRPLLARSIRPIGLEPIIRQGSVDGGHRPSFPDEVDRGGPHTRGHRLPLFSPPPYLDGGDRPGLDSRCVVCLDLPFQGID